MTVFNMVHTIGEMFEIVQNILRKHFENLNVLICNACWKQMSERVEINNAFWKLSTLLEMLDMVFRKLEIFNIVFQHNCYNHAIV